MNLSDKLSEVKCILKAGWWARVSKPTEGSDIEESEESSSNESRRTLASSSDDSQVESAPATSDEEEEEDADDHFDLDVESSIQGFLDECEKARRRCKKKKTTRKQPSSWKLAQSELIELTLFADIRFWDLDYLQKRGGEQFIKAAINNRGGVVQEIYSYRKKKNNIIKLLVNTWDDRDLVIDIIHEIKNLGDTFKGLSRNDLLKRKKKKEQQQFRKAFESQYGIDFNFWCNGVVAPIQS